MYEKLTDVVFFANTLNGDGTINTTNLGSGLGSKVANMRNAAITVNPGIRTAFSIGGAGQDQNFDTVCANLAYRSNLITNAINYCITNNLDGVDLDWESLDRNSSTHAEDYTKLACELGQACHNNGLTLTIAIRPKQWWGSPSQPFDLMSTCPASSPLAGQPTMNYVDYLYVMAYDLFVPDHSTFDNMVDLCLTPWKDEFGAPASQIVAGVPFYGRIDWGNDHTYKEIYDQYKAEHDGSTIPTTSDHENLWGSEIGFNGVDTIKQKTQYVIDNQYAGVMIWEISQDLPTTYPDYATHSLLNAVNNTVPEPSTYTKIIISSVIFLQLNITKNKSIRY